MWTPLDCAAAKGWMKTAKCLLEADSPIDPMDKAKVTHATSEIKLKINNTFECKIVNIFLPICFNTCFGCSKEPSH